MKKQHLSKRFSEIKSRFENWQRNFNKTTAGKSMLEIIAFVSKEISIGIVITSGLGKQSSYSGPYYKCKRLKDKYPESRMQAIGYYWCWFGIASAEEIQEVVKNDNYSKLHFVKTKPEDVIEMTNYLASNLSFDNTFGEEKLLMAYIGSRAVCVRLLHQYKGKIGRIGDAWHWIGSKASFEDISRVITSYRKHAKRCNKKRVSF